MHEIVESFKRASEKVYSYGIDAALLTASTALLAAISPAVALYGGGGLALEMAGFHSGGSVSYLMFEPEFFGPVVVSVWKKGNRVFTAVRADYFKGEEKVLSGLDAQHSVFNVGRLRLRLEKTYIVGKDKPEYIVFEYTSKQEPSFTETPLIAFKTLSLLASLYKNKITVHALQLREEQKI